MIEYKELKGVIMRKVFISVDCGFDKFKVAVDDRCISFSSKMVDATDMLASNNAGVASSNMYIEYNGRTYEFGDSIDEALSLKNNLSKYKEFLDTFRNLSRFHTDAFHISLLAAIGYAIIAYDRNEELKKSEKIATNLDNIEFAIGIALPHESLNEWDNLKGFLKQQHNFNLLLGSLLVKFPFALDFSKAEFLCNSQVISAFLYEATNDDNVLVDKHSLLPCAIIDAGYKTLGCFEIAGNLAINAAQSNTDFAMLNVDMIVAERVRQQGRQDFNYLQVQHHARGNGRGFIRSSDKEIDVKSIYKEVLREVCDGLLSYIEHIFSLDDIFSLIITGGTGVAYADQITEYMEKYHRGLKVIITKKPYRGGPEIDPMYAIVLGLHKQLQEKYR